MNQRQQERQLGRIPRLHQTIEQLKAANPKDKRLEGLRKELDRRMAEVNAFALSDEGEGFDEQVAEAIAALDETKAA